MKIQRSIYASLSGAHTAERRHTPALRTPQVRGIQATRVPLARQSSTHSRNLLKNVGQTIQKLPFKTLTVVLTTGFYAWTILDTAGWLPKILLPAGQNRSGWGAMNWALIHNGHFGQAILYAYIFGGLALLFFAKPIFRLVTAPFVHFAHKLFPPKPAPDVRVDSRLPCDGVHMPKLPADILEMLEVMKDEGTDIPEARMQLYRGISRSTPDKSEE